MFAPFLDPAQSFEAPSTGATSEAAKIDREHVRIGRIVEDPSKSMPLENEAVYNRPQVAGR
jgi:hypothetical protein